MMPTTRRKKKTKTAKRPLMTKAEARAWKRRWRLVNEFTLAEARAATPEERLRDLDILFRSRGMFRWPTEEEAGVPEVRRRWLKLKKSGV